jgi:hypothetical protein
MAAYRRSEFDDNGCFSGRSASHRSTRLLVEFVIKGPTSGNYKTRKGLRPPAMHGGRRTGLS